jgi:hypothetical protein
MVTYNHSNSNIVIHNTIMYWCIFFYSLKVSIHNLVLFLFRIFRRNTKQMKERK